jgi:hypothetical protein
MRTAIRFPALSLFGAAACIALGGCASVDMSGYPSLARRPVERQAAVVIPVPAAPAPPAIVSATLADAIRGLARDADAGEAAFRAALGPSQAAIAGGEGAAIGSEGWAQAQTALSRIDAARAPTSFALAELDRLALQAGDGGDATGVAALTAEQARVAALAAEQVRVLDALGRSLSR